MKYKLTARQVTTIKKVGRHSDGNGLYLKVDKSQKTGEERKCWILRWGAQGVKSIGLGSYPTVSLAMARQKAEEVRLLISQGVDPREERERLKNEKALAKSNSVTFEEASKEYILKKAPSWRNPKSEQQWSNTLESYAHPFIGKMQCSKIQKQHVLEVLEPIWHEKHETATRIRGRIQTILDWAIAKGYRKDSNPAIFKGNLQHVLTPIPKKQRVKHHAAMAYTQVPIFFVNLQLDPSISAKALLICILTATRTSELIKARWEEFELDRKIWNIPSTRMKATIPHRVALSNQACAALEMLNPKKSGWIFKSEHKNASDHISSMTMLTYLQRKSGCEDLTVHGFRSTFRDWAGEVGRFPREICEHALAHQIEDEAEAAYQRGDHFDARIELMQSWADYCFSGPKQSNENQTDSILEFMNK